MFSVARIPSAAASVVVPALSVPPPETLIVALPKPPTINRPTVAREPDPPTSSTPNELVLFPRVVVPVLDPSPPPPTVSVAVPKSAIVSEPVFVHCDPDPGPSTRTVAVLPAVLAMTAVDPVNRLLFRTLIVARARTADGQQPVLLRPSGIPVERE